MPLNLLGLGAGTVQYSLILLPFLLLGFNFQYLMAMTMTYCMKCVAFPPTPKILLVDDIVTNCLLISILLAWLVLISNLMG